ncbi:MAG: class I SAM-dependent methyltransferase [Firmicutes bacterium]|nr:class I SAM-dependent methyltransferase [Bacillota bacterium]
MDNIYAFPQYYEIAFSYRDIIREVDVMEQAIAQYSHIPVENVLELACGNSPHMVELASRGYNYHGLDLSPTMLEFAQEKTRIHDFNANFYLANLVDFEVKEPLDFIYIMLGSLYVGDTKELLSHFSSVERALKPGGLYFLDWCVDFSPLDNVQDSWVMRKNKITVTTHYTTRPYNPAEQLYQERISFTVKDRGKQHRLVHSGLRRAIFPQEFLLVSTKLHNFEFLGWWNNWNWQAPLGENEGREEIVRPITILRRV